MKFRKTLKITSRTSSVTNGFVQAIIPCVEPSGAETRAALAALGMSPADISCAYCGAPSTDWDHLRPLVRGKRPTGYANDVRNLVPAWGPCNQSKSGQHWADWMAGSAKGSPTSRGVSDVASRMKALAAFDVWSRHEPLDLPTIVGAERWEAYWLRLEEIERLMHEAQREASEMRKIVEAALVRQFDPDVAD